MNTSVLDRAIQAAARQHSGQMRDGDDPLPYITHPIEVLDVLRYVGEVTDLDLLCGAVLHDVVEQSSATLDQIEAIAGLRTRDLVKELTREEPTSGQTEGMTKAQIWELRSQMLLAEIAKMSPDAKQIKLADRLSNIREAKRAKSGEKLARYIRQTKEILKIIPRETNPGLWDAIKRELR